MSESVAGEIALLVNPNARRGGGAFEAAAARLEAAGLHLRWATQVQGEDVRGTIEQWLADGAREVVVGGGDGTLSAAAQALVGTDATLAVLPLGTGNDFARSLRIPLDFEAACAIAATGERRQVDVGEVGTRTFLNAASVGLSTAVTERLSAGMKRTFGRAAFAVAAASEAWSHQPFRVELATPELTRSLLVHQVVVASGRYHGGGRVVSPVASVTSHLLDAYVITAATEPGPPTDPSERIRELWTLLRVGLLLRRGRHLTHPNVEHFRTSSLSLTTDPPQRIDVDGELVGETPATFRIRPAALWVRAPAKLTAR